MKGIWRLSSEEPLRPVMAVGRPPPYFPNKIRENNIHATNWRLSTESRYKLPLDAGRAAFGKRLHLLHGCHCCVAREGGQQRAVRPAQLHRLFRFFALQQAVEKSRREAVAAA